jgi:hypothetical protein
MTSLAVRLCFVSAVVFALSPRTSIAAPEAVLWPKWQAHNDSSTTAIDHSAWDHFLKTYAHEGKDGIVRVAYGRVDAAEHAALGADLKRLAALPIDTYNRNEQRAYWIDLYNELTVNFVLDHYPITGIKATSFLPGIFSETPWSRKLITIEGERISLDDIEHRILRPGWHDPRIHYALNCASLGCPNLQPLAFTAANTDELLDRAAREYVNSPRGARVEDGKLIVSSIYVWYKADFGGTDAAVIAHLRRYASPELAKALATVDHISDHHYDWSLNDDPVADHGGSSS